MDSVMSFLQLLLQVIGAAAALAAAMPKATEELGKMYGILRQTVDLLGGNFGNANNAK